MSFSQQADAASLRAEGGAGTVSNWTGINVEPGSAAEKIWWGLILSFTPVFFIGIPMFFIGLYQAGVVGRVVAVLILLLMIAGVVAIDAALG